MTGSHYKEILNSHNSCAPKQLTFQNDTSIVNLSPLQPFNHSTFQPFNFTAPSPASGTIPRRGRELVEPFTPHHSRFTRRKAAFTLAEVLITLGIIGVVAAMTLPALVNKYQERAWLTAFKTNYSILSQAYLRAYQKYGIPEEWGLPDDNQEESCKKAAEYLLPYLNLAKDFKQNDKRSTHRLPVNYLGLNGRKLSDNWNGWKETHYIFALANGATAGISQTGLLGKDGVDDRYLIEIYLDTNGAKGPNQFGKDFFMLFLNTKNNSPIVTGYPKWWVSEKSCSIDSDSTSYWGNGGGCAIWLINHGNMDYLHRPITADEWAK